MDKKFNLLRPSTWFDNQALAAPTGEDVTKKRQKGGTAGKLKQVTEYESKLEIQNFVDNVRLAEDLTAPDRRPLNYHYKEFMKDAHLASLVNTRINKVLAEPFGLYDDNGKLNEEATSLLKRPWFDRFVKYALEARFYGFSIIELPQIAPGREVENVFLIPRDNVDQVAGTIHIHSTNWEDNGIPFREGPLVKDLIEISGGPRDLGLLMICGKWVIYKGYSVSDWSRHSEKFGMPSIAIKTDTSDTKNIDAKEAFLRDFGANAYAILDLTDEIQLIEAAKNDPYKIYDSLIERADAQLSKIVLGQTGTTDEKAFVGSAEVHERTLDDYILADLRSLVYDINYKVIPRLLLRGYPIKGLSFDYKVNREEERDPGAMKKSAGLEDEGEKKLYLSPGIRQILNISSLYQDPHHH